MCKLKIEVLAFLGFYNKMQETGLLKNSNLFLQAMKRGW